MIRSILGLAGFVVVCFAAGAVGGWFTSQSVDDWYRQLAKPSWTPPGAVIGIVWNVLYAMMALAAWRVWRRRGFAEARWALGLFAAQLLLNVGWSILFFGLHAPGAAFIELLILEAAIIATMIAFFRHDRIAGWLLVPYAAWVAFAGVLNATIWWMNQPHPPA